MNTREPLNKILSKSIPSDQLHLLLQSIKDNLPDTFVIDNVTYHKNKDVHIGSNKIGIWLDVKKLNKRTIIFCHTLQDDCPYLVSQLSKSDYDTLVLKRSNPFYQDLLCYNLTSMDNINPQQVLKSSSLAPSDKDPEPKNIQSTQLNSILNDEDGVIFLQHHLDEYSWRYFIEQIKTSNNNTLKYCYLELPFHMLHPLFKEFNETGDIKLLEKHLRLFPLTYPETVSFFVEVCVACHQKGIKVIPVDLNVPLTTTSIQQYSQDRDIFMARFIHRNRTTDPKSKYIGFFGLNHFAISEMLNVPSIAIIPTENSKKIYSQNEEISNRSRFSASECKINQIFRLVASRTIDSEDSKSRLSPCHRFGLFTAAAAAVGVGIFYACSQSLTNI